MQSIGRPLLAVAVALPLVFGCAADGTADKQTVGTLLGAAAGIALGSMVGDGSGRAAAMVAGGLLGGLAGSAIGRQLEERDRLLAARTTERALTAPPPPPGQPGQTLPWQSQQNPNVRGSSQVLGSTQTAQGGECRRMREVAYIEGREVTQTVEYCRAPNGAGWVKRA
jgi:surface antigen